MLGVFRRVIIIVSVLYTSSLFAGEPHDISPRKLTAEEFMVANALWTLLHETAHVVIGELDIIFLGSEEDAADQFATIALLRGEPDFDVPGGVTAAESVVAAATAWRIEWELEKLEEVETSYWDSHSLSIQRFYNMMCLLYGSDPKKYNEMEGQLLLPYERAYGCVDYENARARSAVQRIIETHARQRDSDVNQGKVLVIYEKTFTAEQHQILMAIRRSGIAERLAETLTEKKLALPSDIKIVFAQCANDETAFWHQENKEVVMCYELLARFLYLYQAKQCLEITEISDDELGLCLARWQK